MRVNHAGEVAAQALYHGQAVTAKLPEVRAEMEHAAEEENDHLAWCEERIRELGGEVSALQPFWYAGSFALGALAGAIGDKWSLGFVAETEKQVVKHLEEHETQLPAEDQKTRAILKQMKQDEAEHGEKAMQAGGAELPEVVQLMMSLSSKVMTKTAYWW
jgi:ubiquinone biosynthesis monooxygenase Coq7